MHRNSFPRLIIFFALAVFSAILVSSVCSYAAGKKRKANPYSPVNNCAVPAAKMLDQGYGNGDLKLRLDQLNQALLRDARYLVSIEMHAGKMSYEQAINFFITEGYQSATIATVEAKRGASEPTYLVYTLGKLEILKLRDDYKKLRGDQFTLQEFHDEFLRQGALPIKLIRRAMLGNDGPAQ
jgi:hypothetical protein